MKSAGKGKAAALKVHGFEDTPRPPDVSAKGILRARAFVIPSSQEKLLRTDMAWLDSCGRPGPGYTPVPDKVLKRLQQAAQTDQPSSLPISRRAQGTPAEQANGQDLAAAARNVRATASRPESVDQDERKLESTTKHDTKSPVTVPVATPKQAAATQIIPLESSALRNLAALAISATSLNDGKTLTPTATTKRTLEREPGDATGDATPVPKRGQRLSSLAGEAAMDEPILHPASQSVTPNASPTAVTAAEVLVQTIETEPEIEAQQQQGDPPDSPDWPDEPLSDGGNEHDIFDASDVYADAEKSNEELQKDRHERLPSIANSRRPDPCRVNDSPVNVVCCSSPSVMDVELPDALVERRSSMIAENRQNGSPHSWQRLPSNGPSHPQTPTSILRRKRLQPLLPSDISVDRNSRPVTISPEPDRSVASINYVASREIGQPRQRLMKVPVFPTNGTPFLQARHSMTERHTSSHNGRRRSSLVRGNTLEPPYSTGKIPLSRRLARSRDDFGVISRRETSIPAVATAPTVAAPCPTKETPVVPSPGVGPIEASRDAPTAHSTILVSSGAPATPVAIKETQAAQPLVASPQTWMLPFDAFTAAYPDYKGDLEEFLRACYSLRCTPPGALPGFLFDDIVHAFLDYIEYIHAPPSADASSPQNLTQWYNMHATGLKCKKSVVTRENVASILRVYPDEVWAIEQNATAPGTETHAVMAASKTNLVPPAVAAQVSQEQKEHQGQPTSGENLDVSSQGNSSSRPNSLLQALQKLRESNDASESDLLPEQGRAQSLSPPGLFSGDCGNTEASLDHSRSQAQSSTEAPLTQTNCLSGVTHSSLGDNYDEPLELPSSPIASGLVPAHMDKRFYMMQTPQPAQSRLPSAQDDVGHEQLVEETPARAGQRRSHEELERSGLDTDTVVDVVEEEMAAGVNPPSHSPRQTATTEVSDGVEIDAPENTAVAGAVDSFQAEDEEVTDVRDAAVTSVQSAAEPSRLPLASPTSQRSASTFQGRRVTLAAPDLGMVARMAAAEKVDHVARKRKLPPTMARTCKPAVLKGEAPPTATLSMATAAAEEPLKKKKKIRQSTGSNSVLSASEKFRRFLERKVAGGAALAGKHTATEQSR
ncbi:hypothetical protein SEPCBS119000_005572 [Sporothrix epigloea]|uniref:Uncharacterized protein n=1 Tax=Sporothrix epigloea TaxID=1892477 RepID=A0ABP0E2F1_9PEZI